jgi:hypothetical protein
MNWELIMHENSLLCWVSEQKLFNAREKLILNHVLKYPTRISDRMCMDELGFTDMNSVRPRITRLVKDGWLAEQEPMIDHVTGKTVRTVKPSWKLLSYGKHEQGRLL